MLNSRHAIEKLYKVGVGNFVSLGANMINELLDSTLDSVLAPYYKTLEQDLFCTAVELRACTLLK